MLSRPFEELLSGGLSKCTAALSSNMWSFFAPVAMSACFPSEVFEMLIASPSPFLLFPAAPPDSSSNYIRQLETKVRILEDDNNKLLSQVRHTRSGARQGCRALRRLPRNSPPARLKPETGSCDETKWPPDVFMKPGLSQLSAR